MLAFESTTLRSPSAFADKSDTAHTASPSEHHRRIRRVIVRECHIHGVLHRRRHTKALTFQA
jgi:hypothetical protein